MRPFPRSLTAILFVTFSMSAVLLAQPGPATFAVGREAGSQDIKPLSNSAIEIIVRNDTVLVGGGKGLDITRDGGRSWRHVGQEAPFEHEDIGALAWHGRRIWMSLAGSEKIDQTSVPKGLGLAFSNDNGDTWKRLGQPMEPDTQDVVPLKYGENTIRALAVTTAFNNITYDMALSTDAVWTASFAAGLRVSTDGGSTFRQVILPPDHLDSISPNDSLNFAFELSPVDRPDLLLRGNLNHRVFSVMTVSDSVIWVGTAGGVNVSTDGGVSWRKSTFVNQDQPISGNFVVALGRNVIAGREYVWAATMNALDPREYRAVSYTTDMGRTWRTTLRGVFTHNFGFKGDIVYAATNDGVFRSDDAGLSWIQFSSFSDPASRTRAAQEACYAITAQDDTVWVANSDGLMKTVDNQEHFFGSSWRIFRAWEGLSTPSEAYVYPNPFSPDDEVARVHYRADASGSVSISIYDFAMLPVRTLVRHASRTPDSEQDEIWDGRDDGGRQVANGVYYVQVKIGDTDPVWAKVIVLQ